MKQNKQESFEHPNVERSHSQPENAKRLTSAYLGDVNGLICRLWSGTDDGGDEGCGDGASSGDAGGDHGSGRSHGKRSVRYFRLGCVRWEALLA